MVTLLIIGILTVILLPTIVTANQNKRFSTALKKGYNALNKAFGMVRKIDYCEYRDWSEAYNNPDQVYEDYLLLKNHVNVIRECKNVAGCWSGEQTTGPSGVSTALANQKGMGKAYVTFTMLDGMNVSLDYRETSEVNSILGVNQDLFDNSPVVWIDVNGDAEPNRLGKDVYAFVLTKEGLLPAGANNKSANCKSSGSDCAAIHIYDDDYR